MILFKAAGRTYGRVTRTEYHAFPFAPAEIRSQEFVLLSKNREDCRPTEPQIQYVAKVLEYRQATPEELVERFPGVEAGARWSTLAKLYWSSRLDRPFNLSQVPDLNYRRYDTVQDFARLDEPDELLVVQFLCRANPDVVKNFLNRPDPPSLEAE